MYHVTSHIPARGRDTHLLKARMTYIEGTQLWPETHVAN